jgi:hypothetical protein
MIDRIMFVPTYTRPLSRRRAPNSPPNFCPPNIRHKFFSAPQSPPNFVSRKFAEIFTALVDTFLLTYLSLTSSWLWLLCLSVSQTYIMDKPASTSV